MFWEHFLFSFFVDGFLVVLEWEMATQSSILAWETPWTEEPGGIQSMGLQRVGHDLVTKQQFSCGS